jgi:hypothetical protein
MELDFSPTVKRQHSTRPLSSLGQAVAPPSGWARVSPRRLELRGGRAHVVTDLAGRAVRPRFDIGRALRVAARVLLDAASLGCCAEHTNVRLSVAGQVSKDMGHGPARESAGPAEDRVVDRLELLPQASVRIGTSGGRRLQLVGYSSFSGIGPRHEDQSRSQEVPPDQSLSVSPGNQRPLTRGSPSRRTPRPSWPGVVAVLGVIRGHWDGERSGSDAVRAQ